MNNWSDCFYRSCFSTLVYISTGISRNASSVGSSLPPASTNSLHSSDGVLAVVQRAEANAAARSARQLASSAANGLTRPMTPVSQQTTGFNQVALYALNTANINKSTRALPLPIESILEMT